MLDSAFALGFIALPNVFDGMWGGRFFGFLWYFTLFIAAITSSISMLQPVIAFFEEGLGLKRHASATLLGMISALGCGFVVYFSENTLALDTFDFWVGTFLIYVLAMFQVLLYGWVFGIGRGHDELHQGAHIRIPRFVQYDLKYLAPVYLLAIFVVFCWQELPSKHIPVFKIDVAAVDTLRDGVIPEALTAEMERHELELPEEASITAPRDRGPWTIVGPDGAPVLIIHTVPDATGETVLRVSRYEMGSIETLSRNEVALFSVGFIATVLLFLLILIHIAGRRWRAEGRLTAADG
jgi:neurotransmitter:Na+ symporter, NSS family